jgi:hypothetical protein
MPPTIRYYAQLVGFVVVSAASLTHATVEVDTCGLVIQENGVLSADLDCSAYAGIALTIENHARLDLQGFMLTAGDSAIYCPDGCGIVSTVSRGTIQGGSGAAIETAFIGPFSVSVDNVLITGAGAGIVGGGSVVVKNSEISNNTGAGVSAYQKLIVYASVIRDNGGDGAYGRGGAKVVDSEITGNGLIGVLGDDVSNVFHAKTVVVRSTVTGNGGGVRAIENLKVSESSIDGNVQWGVGTTAHYARLTISDSSVSSNGEHGVTTNGRSMTLKRSSIDDNGGAGVRHVGFSSGGRIKATDTSISGNGEDGIWGPFEDGISLVGCTVANNQLHGIANHSFVPAFFDPCEVKLLGSTVVSGNGLGPDCGVSLTCADVAACQFTEPQIFSGSTCGTSYVLDSGFPGDSWAVCTAD